METLSRLSACPDAVNHLKLTESFKESWQCVKMSFILILSAGYKNEEINRVVFSDQELKE